MLSIEQRIADAIGAKSHQVSAAVALLDGGATVPFIARYRKEATAGLDDTQLRSLEERLHYLRELEDRRKAILESVREQEKLTPELESSLLAAETKAQLEDLYLPFKPKRRTKAQIAREAGLEPLAELLLANPALVPEQAAADYVDPGRNIPSAKDALDGARAILMERFSEEPALVGELRDWLWEHAEVHAAALPGKESAGQKFKDYFDYREGIKQLPSHRLLALFRARNEGIVELALQPIARAASVEKDDQVAAGHAYCEARVGRHFGLEAQGRAGDAWLADTCRLAWRGKLHLHLTLDLFGKARERAEDEAIRVFGDNLKDLLLAAPAGPKTVMGLDPGLRTGVKVAVVDRTGRLLATTAVFPHAPHGRWQKSIEELAGLCRLHDVRLIAIGNGTASRETENLAADLIKACADSKIGKVVVSEAGASVYSASALAAKEFPELDVSLRGAVSIARRLQDPLAELVKIDPKSIGVGQYQHDVNQIKLARALDARVEDCVNAVGVDVNTASVALLARVAGLNQLTAENLVMHRDKHGAFAERRALLDVPRLGVKAFEQAAGFLRIVNGKNPLDASSVHPEAYPVVEAILAKRGKKIADIIGDRAFLQSLDATEFVDGRFGLPTVKDILAELEKPGRDPRPAFSTPTFAAGIESIGDLQVGMILEGRVTNVAAFGAFVDIGVHQDGLVHISALSRQFVSDPRAVVKAGDIVKVKVLEVDLPRKRVGLSMRLDDEPPAAGERGLRAKSKSPNIATNRDLRSAAPPAQQSTAFADAFAKAKKPH